MPNFWKKIRKDFENTGNLVYLDHAAGGPIPRPVAEEIKAYHKELREEADFAWPRWIARREQARRQVARFIHAEPEEVTFTSGTSDGMNRIAALLATEGSVLTNTSEFPSSTVPWLHRKAKMVWQKPQDNRIDLKQLKSQLRSRVKTILTSYVQYATGFKQDLTALGKLKGKRFLVVNATQGFGAMPVDVRKWKADFMCTNSYKWCMADYGGGVLYVRKPWLKKFKPDVVGWRSVENPDAMDNRRIKLSSRAQRYELGCPNFSAIFAIGAACRYFSEIGIQKIESRILALTDYLIEGLEHLGFEVISPKERKHRSGIVVFKVKSAVLLWKRLLSHRIYVSPRGQGIRVAPHFYNDFSEIDIFLKKLKRLTRR